MSEQKQVAKPVTPKTSAAVMNVEEKKKADQADLEAQIAALQKQVEEANKSKQEFEEEALKAACARAGVDVKDLLAIEESKKMSKDQIAIDIGKQVVHINGFPFTGKMTVDRAMAESILHMAHSEKLQRLKELTGNKYDIEMLASGGVSAKLVETYKE